jgi:Flp pilus assembly pilin Flp
VPNQRSKIPADSVPVSPQFHRQPPDCFQVSSNTCLWNAPLFKSRLEPGASDLSHHDLVTTVDRRHGRAIVRWLRRVHSEDIRLPGPCQLSTGVELTDFLRNAWWQEEGQDVAEYAVMLAVILAIAIGTVKLIGANASNVLANVGSAIQ